MKSKMVITEHQKAQQEPEVYYIPTKLKKNDVSYPSERLHFSVANFVYKSSCL